MSGGQNELVFGDQIQHIQDLWQELPILGDTNERSRRFAVPDFIFRIERRHVDDFAVLAFDADKMFHGGGIDAPDQLIQNNPAEYLQPRSVFASEIGKAGSGVKMVHNHHSANPSIFVQFRKLQNIKRAASLVWIGMGMYINYTLKCLHRYNLLC